MILHSVLIAALLTGNSGTAPDRWFGEDKLKHFAATFVVSTMTASGARAAGFDRPNSIAIGVGTGAASGLLKEIHDARAGGTFSVRDLVWDLAGAGTAAVVLDAAR